jgi:prolyl-tRNA synthetase
MKGVPVRIELGPRDLKNGSAMLVRRDTGQKQQIPLGSIADEVLSMFRTIQADLYEKAKTDLQGRIFDCKSSAEVKEKITMGIAKVFWCGRKECGLQLEDEIGAGILGIPTGQEACQGKCITCNDDANTQVYVARTY